MRKNQLQYAVLGLGIFGSSVAKTLSSYDCEVLAIDKDEKCVNRISEYVSDAVVCDFSDLTSLKMTGISDCDVVFVCSGEHLEESIMAIINLKELGVETIIAKAKNKRYKQIYESLGVSKIVRPEKEMGEQVARSALGKNIVDLIDLDDDYSIMEINTPQKWLNKTLAQLQLRKHGINVIGIRYDNQAKLDLIIDPSKVLTPQDRLVIITDIKNVDKLIN